MRKVILQSVFIGLACLLALITAATFYMNYLDEKITEEIKTNLSEVSQKNAESIHTKLTDNITLVKTMATYLQEESLNEKKIIVNKLASIAKNNGFKRIGVADSSGDCLTSDGVALNIKDRDYFQKALKGEASVSEILEDKVGVEGQKINAYAAPIYRGDKVNGVLFFVNTTDDFTSSLLVKSFQGEGYSIIIDSKGKILLKIDHKNAIQNFESFEDIKVIDDMNVTDFIGQKGVGEFMAKDGIARFMAFEPLHINDWSVVSIVPSSVVATRINSFSKMAFITWFAFIVVFMGLVLYIYFMWNRNNKKVQSVLFEDSLTGYDNFNRFKLNVQSALHDAQDTTKYCIIEFDIYDFKMFNKMHGYAAGDDLLITIMHITDRHCHKGEYCARISEDRYVIFFEECDSEQIKMRITKIDHEIKQAFSRDHQGIQFHLCFGIYQLKQQDEDVMKNLDRAIYAKNHIKHDMEYLYCFYSEDMYEQIMREKEIEKRMYTALERQEFVVYLQPKVEVHNFQIIAAEALIRWNDPQRGLIPPNEFIPLFERNGFLERLDMFVIEKVCQLLQRWMKEGKSLISISVNVSKSYIFAEGFAKRVKDILDHYGIDPKLIEIEITESIIFDRSKELIAVIKQLKAYGFSISMDDFGSGYSSLNMLREIPIDIIKLDQVFFGRGNAENEVRSKLIVEGLLDMINLLHIDTVAEGVETEEQINFLKGVKCHVAQGYYFYKPMPIVEFDALIHQDVA